MIGIRESTGGEDGHLELKDEGYPRDSGEERVSRSRCATGCFSVRVSAIVYFRIHVVGTPPGGLTREWRAYVIAYSPIARSLDFLCTGGSLFLRGANPMLVVQRGYIRIVVPTTPLDSKEDLRAPS